MRKSLKIIFVLLIISAIVVGVLVVNKYGKRYLNEKRIKDTLAQILDTAYIESGDIIGDIDAEIEGYKVVGIIKIPKINLEYPILEKANTHTLSLSIVKFWGPDINQVGNVTLAGHNYINGIFFGSLRKLEKGDIIELTNSHRIMLKYEVYKIQVIDPNDISILLPEQEGIRELTLYTCTNGRENRLVIRARQIVENI